MPNWRETGFSPSILGNLGPDGSPLPSRQNFSSIIFQGTGRVIDCLGNKGGDGSNTNAQSSTEVDSSGTDSSQSPDLVAKLNRVGADPSLIIEARRVSSIIHTPAGEPMQPLQKQRG
jgi:hypothetical protein